jgi:hypothetical protein
MIVLWFGISATASLGELVHPVGRCDAVTMYFLKVQIRIDLLS